MSKDMKIFLTIQVVGLPIMFLIIINNLLGHFIFCSMAFGVLYFIFSIFKGFYNFYSNVFDFFDRHK